MILLEDDDIKVLAPAKGFADGQINIVPNQKALILEQVPSVLLGKMFQVAVKLSSVQFESLGVQGTNIVIQNGVSSGQEEGVFSMKLIPRKEGDGLVFYESKQATPSELDDVLHRLLKDEPEEDLDEAQKEIVEKPQEIPSHLYKSLRRMP